jgi:hypothetical protein
MKEEVIRRILGARITRFGVAVKKIRNFEVLGLFLWIFPRLGTPLELFFKNQGSECKIWTAGWFPKGSGTFLQNL